VHFEGYNLLCLGYFGVLANKSILSIILYYIRIASSMDNMEVSGTDSISDVGTATMVA